MPLMVDFLAGLGLGLLLFSFGAFVLAFRGILPPDFDGEEEEEYCRRAGPPGRD